MSDECPYQEAARKLLAEWRKAAAGMALAATSCAVAESVIGSYEPWSTLAETARTTNLFPEGSSVRVDVNNYMGMSIVSELSNLTSS